MRMKSSQVALVPIEILKIIFLSLILMSKKDPPKSGSFSFVEDYNNRRVSEFKSRIVLRQVVSAREAISSSTI
jgi:hypothetical protein